MPDEVTTTPAADTTAAPTPAAEPAPSATPTPASGGTGTRSYGGPLRSDGSVAFDKIFDNAVSQTPAPAAAAKPSATTSPAPADRPVVEPGGSTTTKIGEYNVDGARLSGLLSAFGGDLDKLDRALKHPDKLYSILQSNLTQKEQAVAEKRKELDALIAQTRQAVQARPRPEPAPAPIPTAPAAPVPTQGALDETDAVFGEHNKALNAQQAKIAALEARFAAMETGASAPAKLDTVSRMVIDRQFGDIRQAYGDDAMRNALDIVGRQYGWQIKDGRLDYGNSTPEEIVQGMEQVSFFGQRYRTHLDNNDKALDEGLSRITWLKELGDIPEAKELSDWLTTRAFDDAMLIQRQAGKFPLPDHLSTLVEDRAARLITLLDAINAKRATARAAAPRPIVSNVSRQPETSTSRPKGPPLKPDGSVDFEAIHRLATEQAGAT